MNKKKLLYLSVSLLLVICLCACGVNGDKEGKSAIGEKIKLNIGEESSFTLDTIEKTGEGEYTFCYTAQAFEPFYLYIFSGNDAPIAVEVPKYIAGEFTVSVSGSDSYTDAYLFSACDRKGSVLATKDGEILGDFDILKFDVKNKSDNQTQGYYCVGIYASREMLEIEIADLCLYDSTIDVSNSGMYRSYIMMSMT